MIVLGLLLILIAAGAVVFAVIAPSATAETIVVTALGVKVSASPLAMFLAGAVSVVLLGIAYLLISRGARRKARSRKELRDLRKEQAAAGASTSTEGGHRSSRSDRHPKGNNTATDTGTGPDTTKAVQPDQHQESEPPSSS